MYHLQPLVSCGVSVFRRCSSLNNWSAVHQRSTTWLQRRVLLETPVTQGQASPLPPVFHGKIYISSLQRIDFALKLVENGSFLTTSGWGWRFWVSIQVRQWDFAPIPITCSPKVTQGLVVTWGMISWLSYTPRIRGMKPAESDGSGAGTINCGNLKRLNWSRIASLVCHWHV